MTAPSDLRLLTLHGLRLKGVAMAPAVADAMGLAVVHVETELERLATEGLVAHRDGRLAGWSLTTAGRAAHEQVVASELDQLGSREAVHDGYQRFLALNPRLLGACTRWQLRDDRGTPQLNDHSDPDYDAAVIADLVEIHHGVEPVLADLESVLARYGRYRPAMAAALGAVRAGDPDMFARPGIPSYHTLWFELHEDLLTTLSIERGSEVTA
jgi:hypothetical protein